MWLNTIGNEIRKAVDKLDIEAVINVALEDLKKFEDWAGDNEDLQDLIADCKDHFEFLRDLKNGTIPVEEWKNFGFDGEFREWSDNYLSEFYDICDYPISKVYKFVWVNF